MKTADQIIDALGGTTAVATGLGLTPSTVSSWREVNFIPKWRHPAMLAFAMASDKPLGTGDFPTEKQRKPRVRNESAAA